MESKETSVSVELVFLDAVMAEASSQKKAERKLYESSASLQNSITV